MTIPTLGYPSRLAAVLALKAQGMRNFEIAATLGVSRNVVGAFVHYGLKSDPDTVRIAIPGDIVRSLRVHAKARGVTVADLARAILEAGCDGCVVALLGDVERK
jgi:DNA-binding transcriptional regulator LsrR (DeoR family)